LQDPQGADGVWMIAGDYKVSGVPNVTEITVLPTHTDEHPLDRFAAANYAIPPRTPVQTVLLPAGATNGQSLGWPTGPASVPASAPPRATPAPRGPPSRRCSCPPARATGRSSAGSTAPPGCRRPAAAPPGTPSPTSTAWRASWQARPRLGTTSPPRISPSSPS